ncbi:nucleoside triphosphate pyrophosphohydrolase [Polycladomyces subterraneus]|uniref:Nucleoside triphosphate pyrophosphohydrolase n=1 Tax=Polycladomyces subterraneus TaxID=1016997 RepID=A0ABT8IL12_9BACL|nr:nucleoside triphosphate pyrophosphohydrolase [Polycladomyces subterraneus]MDN4593480.1 nucleoside triphosphate pyrophosphohydrolase [Polycladomyces subterraneus]
MQGTITIVGLGFGDISALPMGTLETLERADALWLRTEDHPVVDWLRERGLGFATFDSVYEAHADFESVYREIVDRLLAEAKAGRPVVYAVPGHPMVAERTVRLLREEGNRHGIQVDVRGGGSFLDAAFARLGIDPIDGFLLLDGTDLSADRLDPRVHQLIAQVYDRMVASDIKLTLMEVYPDDFPVTVASALGVEERERIETVPLYQLDHEERFDNLTLLYIPPTDEERVLNRRFDTLTGIIERLRGPGGCPWDRKQTHQSLRKYLLEEAYEFLDALAEGNPDEMADELGDVLLQVVLHAQIAREEGTFDIRDVIGNLSEKLIRRHPHVFGNGSAETAEDVKRKWDEIKQLERADQPEPRSLLDGVSSQFPALLRSMELQKRAAKVGFDWETSEDVRDKVMEELDELFRAEDPAHREEELGDLLFVVSALARFFDVDPEQALLGACHKFIKRFQWVEKRAREDGRPLSEIPMAQLDAWWEEAKENMRDEQ